MPMQAILVSFITTPALCNTTLQICLVNTDQINQAGASSASVNATTNTPTPSAIMKRPRGRPSKASLAATTAAAGRSADSITTSNYSESLSGYSTPLTSNGTTPAESSRAAKLEVVLPMGQSRASAPGKSTQQTQDYMLGNDSKKKRAFTEIADSDDDMQALLDSSPAAQRLRQDELIARQMQEVLDEEMQQILDEDEQGAYEVDDSDVVDSDELLSDYMDNTTNGKGKGKAKAVAPRRRGRPAKKAAVEYSDDSDDLSAVEYAPPAKKRKTAVSKGKGKASALSKLNTATSRAKGKGKASALSESDLESSDAVPRA